MLSILIPCADEENVHLFIKDLEEKVPCGEIIIARDRDRKGKGWALRQAFEQASGNHIAFIDGDGEIPARMLLRLLPFLEDFDAVVGSKRITKAPLRRKIMTHVTRIAFRLMFGVLVDTQTGVKLFRRSALEAIDDWDANGFIYDVQLLEQMQRMGKKIIEVPVEVEIKRQLAFKTIFNITGEAIWLKSRLLYRRVKSMLM